MHCPSQSRIWGELWGVWTAGKLSVLMAFHDACINLDPQLIPGFTFIFSRSQTQYAVPTCFKKSTIVSVPKKPRHVVLNNFCPAALTFEVMICFERPTVQRPTDFIWLVQLLPCNLPITQIGVLTMLLTRSMLLTLTHLDPLGWWKLSGETSMGNATFRCQNPPSLHLGPVYQFPWWYCMSSFHDDMSSLKENLTLETL